MPVVTTCPASQPVAQAFVGDEQAERRKDDDEEHQFDHGPLL
jgi:hypothetical protein